MLKICTSTMLRENQKMGWEGGNLCDNRLGVKRTVM